jgi:DNA-binding XRE family transcriptional regulator
MPKKKKESSFAQRFPTRNSMALERLSENVRNLRKMREISQEALAELVEIDQTDISHIENARGNPTVLVLERRRTRHSTSGTFRAKRSYQGG